MFAFLNLRNSSKSLFQKWKDIYASFLLLFENSVQERQSKIKMFTSCLQWFWKLLRRVREGLEGRNWFGFGTMLLKTLVSFRTGGSVSSKKILRKKTIYKEDPSSSHIKPIPMQSAWPLTGHRGHLMSGYPLYVPWLSAEELWSLKT